MKRGIYVYEGVEQFKPYGNYSMAAIIGVTRYVRHWRAFDERH